MPLRRSTVGKPGILVFCVMLEYKSGLDVNIANKLLNCRWIFMALAQSPAKSQISSQSDLFNLF